jgi:hypothetical protein
MEGVIIMKNRVKLIIVIVIFLIIPGCGAKKDSISLNKIQATQSSSTPPKQESSTNIDNNTFNEIDQNMDRCQKELESLGKFSVQGNKADYESGRRIFPLLDFILTKKSTPANIPKQLVFMKDNPIFVTDTEKYTNTLVFAPIHSKRTGVLHAVTGYPDNIVTNYYEPMVFGKKNDFTPEIPSVYVDSLNKSIEVNRETWVNELSEYTKACRETLILPPTNTKRPFFHYNGKIYPFSKEIDFVTGVEGVGFGLEEDGIAYYGDDNNKITIPILIYSPQNKIENVVMIQDGVELKFHLDEHYSNEWQKWLGSDWHFLVSEKVDFNEDVFSKADFSQIQSNLPPFISDNSSIIQITINGEKVKYFNH